MKPTDVIKRPVALTEKATRLKEANKVVFEVALGANKLEIKSAVETLFNVKVADVNTLVQRGKFKRMGRGIAKRPNYKKAVVTLREGSLDGNQPASMPGRLPRHPEAMGRTWTARSAVDQRKRRCNHLAPLHRHRKCTRAVETV